MQPSTPRLGMGRILLFWSPLAATWLMMSLEGPFVSAIIARLPDPSQNLAAFGVAFSLALLAESPVIMLMAAATALVTDAASFRTLRRFAYLLSAGVSLLMALIALGPLFDVLARRAIGLDGPLAELTRVVCLVMIPWPGVIGYRRFYQGVLIRSDKTRSVALGTVVRLAAMAASAGAAALLLELPGAVVGGMALTAGVTAEALASRAMASGCIRGLDHEGGFALEALTWSRLSRFYMPLALTTVLALGVRPIITFFLGQSRAALESLAVFPVVHAVTFLFICLGISYQEAVIALMGKDHQHYLPLRRFAGLLMLLSCGGLGIVAFTPLNRFWFQEVSGLSPALAPFAGQALHILWALPALWVLVSFQRAVLVDAARTRPITAGTAVQVLTIAAVLLLAIQGLDLVGIQAAALALLAGSAAGCLALVPHCLRVRREMAAAVGSGLRPEGSPA